MSLSASMMRDHGDWIDRVVAWRDMPVLRSDTGQVVLWINTGIVTIPSLR